MTQPSIPHILTPCVFCKLGQRAPDGDRIGSVFVLLDNYPVTPGHTLVIPVAHRDSYFDMLDDERADVDWALFTVRDHLLAQDPSITGWNIGWNCGASAGQTILHAHAHVIPRRDNDVPHPRGGVRGVIPDKQNY